MHDGKLRQRIAWEAARLIYGRQEAHIHKARLRAARRFGGASLRSWELPSNREIREQVQLLADEYSAGRGPERLRETRLAVLRLMRLLRAFCPRLRLDTLGHGDEFDDRDKAALSSRRCEIELAAEHLDPVLASLAAEQVACQLILINRDQETGRPRRALLRTLEATPIDLDVTIGTRDRVAVAAPRRADIADWEQFLLDEYPEMEVTDSLLEAPTMIDCLEHFRALLAPLEKVRQKPESHPEGDALYHSLQVFDLAREELPYDQEFLQAALLHDVGKAIDPHDHVAAALEALAGNITERTAWLIEHHSEANALRDGKLGVRSRRRLEQSESFEELMLLSKCDRSGRQIGVRTSDIDEALDYLRELAESCGE